MLSNEPENYRLIIWKVIITDLNYTTLIVNPALLIMKALAIFNLKFSKMLTFLVIYALYIIWIVSMLLKESMIAKNFKNPDIITYVSSFKEVFSATNQFNFISKIGVCIIAALSGFSMVKIPFNYWRRYDSLVININKSRIEDDISATMEEIRLEMIELSSYSVADKKMSNAQEPKKGFMGGVFTSLFGTKMDNHEHLMLKKKRNIKTSQNLLDSLYMDYCEISSEEEKIKMRKTKNLKCLIDFIGGHYLAVLLTYKFFNTIRLLIIGRNKPSDPISNILRFIAK